MHKGDEMEIGDSQDLAAPVEDGNPAESAPATEATEQTPVNTGKPDPSESQKYQKRIDELTWKAREWERRYYESLPQQPQPAPKAEPVVPTLEQHGYDEAKYQQALLNYWDAVADAKAEAKVEQKLKEREERTQYESRAKSFKTREAEFVAKVADYQEKVYDPSLPITPAMVELIAESSEGPQLAYYLANNREIAAQIASLPPMLAAREMGRIEAKLSQPAPKPVPVSKAPPPPPKVEVTEEDSDPDPDEPDSDKLTHSQWLKKREKQIRNRK